MPQPDGVWGVSAESCARSIIGTSSFKFNVNSSRRDMFIGAMMHNEADAFSNGIATTAGSYVHQETRDHAANGLYIGRIDLQLTGARSLVDVV